jgi:hypothetical protein
MTSKRVRDTPSSALCTKRRLLLDPTTLEELVEHHCGPCVNVVMTYSNGNNFDNDYRFSGGDPEWLTQWFTNREHFYCLMKNQGMHMMRSNMMMPGKTRFPGDNSLENPIWKLFEETRKSKIMANAVQLGKYKLYCRLYHNKYQQTLD